MLDELEKEMTLTPEADVRPMEASKLEPATATILNPAFRVSTPTPLRRLLGPAGRPAKTTGSSSGHSRRAVDRDMSTVDAEQVYREGDAPNVILPSRVRWNSRTLYAVHAV